MSPTPPVYDWLDERPLKTLAGTAVVSCCVFIGWGLLSDRPALFERAGVEHRTAIYTLIANSAVALLAVTLTALAILVALPDRPGVEALKRKGALHGIQRDLLASAALCLLLLVVSIVGTSVDRGKAGNAWVGGLTLGIAVTTLISVLLVGLAFGLALFRTDDPKDPASERVRL